jgi:peptidoglycan/xylan/chitin deacetylase (PgdA/CDA1 family)
MTDRAVLSVDLELFDQTPAYRSASGTTDEDGVGVESTRFLLEAFDAYDAEATFFVVSTVADRYPGLVEHVTDAGHEVGSHTHTHRLLSDLDAGPRREELVRSRERLEAITGASVTGFRAPAFDLPPDHFEELARAGYEYDSSVVASRRIPGWYGGEYDLQAPAPATRVDPDAPDGVAELPAGVMPGVRLPLTGTWLRFFGVRYTVLGMRLLARRGIAPVLYVHPWEFADLPAVDGVPRRVYVRTGEWMRKAVQRLLDQPFEFVTARSVVEGTVTRGEVPDRNDATRRTRSGGDDPTTEGDRQ